MKWLAIFVILIVFLLWYTRPEIHFVVLIAVLASLLVLSAVFLKKPEPFTNKTGLHVYAIVPDPDTPELNGVVSSVNAAGLDIIVVVSKNLGVISELARKHTENDIVIAIDGHSAVMLCSKEALIDAINPLDIKEKVIYMPNIAIGTARAWKNGKIVHADHTAGRVISAKGDACFLHTERASDWAPKTPVTKTMFYL